MKAAKDVDAALAETTPQQAVSSADAVTAAVTGRYATLTPSRCSS